MMSMDFRLRTTAVIKRVKLLGIQSLWERPAVPSDPPKNRADSGSGDTPTYCATLPALRRSFEDPSVVLIRAEQSALDLLSDGGHAAVLKCSLRRPHVLSLWPGRRK